MQKKVKIGFLTERMLLGFGVDLVVHKTACELVDQGFDVTVFCIRSDNTYKKEKYKIVEIACPIYKNPLKTEWSTIKALRRLNYEDIDIWVAQTFPFFIAPRIMARPVIIVDHGVVSTQGFPFMKKLYFDYMKFAQNYFYFPAATKVINISRYTQSLTPKILRKKQSIIYNGVDNYPLADLNEIENFKKQNGILDNDVILLYVGRLKHKDQPYKGTKELVEIYKRIKAKNPKIKLIMAGFGDKKDEKWLKNEGIMPIICAPVELMSILYSIADIYVTASKWEGFNLPLIESGWFSTPAVAYDIGPHKEVLQNGAGFLVKTKDEFIEKLLLLVSDEKLRNQMAQNANKNARRFLWSKTGKEYEEAIIEVTQISQLKKTRCEEELVDVITLNYNGKQYLEKLFDSLKKQTYKKIKVTMVDNGSSDDSVQYTKKNYPWVNLITSKKNLFFSRGNNLAVSKTNGEYIFFLNNDTVVKEDAVEEMVKTFKRQGKFRVAAVSAKMLFYKDPKIIDSVGTVIVGNGSPFNRGIGQIDIGQYNKEEEIFGACFGAAMVRRTVFENTVGKLDNSYFGYFEDVDWCLRARNFGYKILSSPKAVVYHDHSGSSKKNAYDWKYYLIQRNFIRTIIKNFQTERAVRKTLWRIISLAHHGFKNRDMKRKWIVVKILANTFFYLPFFLAKRIPVQMKRCVSDQESIKFSEYEKPMFSPAEYIPEYSLENLSLTFLHLDKINNFEDHKISEIASRALYLEYIKKLMDNKKWEQETSNLIESASPYFDEKYIRQFRKEIIEEKRWNENEKC